jgi:hypothetical protein
MTARTIIQLIKTSHGCVAVFMKQFLGTHQPIFSAKRNELIYKRNRPRHLRRFFRYDMIWNQSSSDYIRRIQINN